MPLTVSLIEDDALTRESLAALIARDAGLKFLHGYQDAETALTGLPQAVPDVLLVDLHLPGLGGSQCIEKLKSRLPDLQVLVLTTYDDTDNIFRALRAGASGYLLKRCPAPEILAAIHEVAQGGAPMSAGIARKVVAHFHNPPAKPAASDLPRLTDREEEILALLAQGLQYKEIAARLDISTSTVRAHLHTIYVKLHVGSRTEAVVKYLRR